MSRTKEEVTTLVRAASALYNLLQDGETLQVHFPLSNLVGLDGKPKMGIMQLTRPMGFSIFQASNTPPPVSLPTEGEKP